MKRFSISIINDGKTSPYGREHDLDIEEATLEAVYYDVVSKRWLDDEVMKKLDDLNVHGSYNFGDSFISVIIRRDK